MSAAEWTDTYCIHHWRILGNSYRKLDWLGRKTTTTDFLSTALTNSVIRPWDQVALRANFVELLQFHLFVQCSRFISASAFVSCRIFFKQNLAQLIIWVQWNRLIHMKTTTEGFSEVRVESLSGISTHKQWILLRTSNQLSYLATSSTRTQSKLCTATLISFLSLVFKFLFSHCLRQSPHFL